MTYGNSKLPSWIATINFSTAQECPALLLGICKNSKICYGIDMERRWTTTKRFHVQQALFFDTLSAEQIAILLTSEIKLRRERYKTSMLRFSVVGDLKDQASVNKFTEACRLIKNEIPITIYGYTAMHHLDFTELMKYATVNGSDFMLSNSIRVVDTFSKQADIECTDNCAKCNACMVPKGYNIEIIKTQNKSKRWKK